jgi:hypothetical protein
MATEDNDDWRAAQTHLGAKEASSFAGDVQEWCRCEYTNPSLTEHHSECRYNNAARGITTSAQTCQTFP